jgi:hypothetical protein
MTSGVAADGPTPHRRWSPLSVLLLVGIALTGGGGLTLALSQTAQVALAADRAEIPDPLEFEARDSRYRILLLADPLAIQIPFQNGAEAYFLCEVVLSDGTIETIDTGTQFMRTETDLGIQLGEFDAVAGPSTVTCRWKDGRASQFYYYSVAPASSIVTIVGGIVLAIGIVALSLAVWLMIRSRTQAVTNKRPLSAAGEAAGAP